MRLEGRRKKDGHVHLRTPPHLELGDFLLDADEVGLQLPRDDRLCHPRSDNHQARHPNRNVLLRRKRGRAGGCVVPSGRRAGIGAKFASLRAMGNPAPGGGQRGTRYSTSTRLLQLRSAPTSERWYAASPLTGDPSRLRCGTRAGGSPRPAPANPTRNPQQKKGRSNGLKADAMTSPVHAHTQE